ncbi:hypothetical protein LBMAG49_15120 [Planctomycetota bacterium]|nr:hypothetical protein LBMAG49_15120 [Planctomycetota bacterium]
MNDAPRVRLYWLIAAAAAIAAFAHAWSLRWSCDDAFISFRYAQHLVDGHGLRFNLDPSEPPVEGYTNFLWTVWLALGMALGFCGDLIEDWSFFWGSFFHAGTVLVVAWLVRRYGRPGNLVPIAACVYAATHHAASLAPAGLETALFVLLGVAMLAIAIGPRSLRSDFALGLLGTLAAMTRPDGAIFCASAGLVVLFDACRVGRVRSCAAFALPFVVGFLPYLIFRHAYYGYWVPNTFFAKSGSDPYLGQGLAYVWEFAKAYRWVFYLVAVAWLACWRMRRPAFLTLLFVLPYLLFVAWVGGDFMFGRFVLPILPMVLLGLDFAVRTWQQSALLAAVAVTCVLNPELPAWLDDYKGPVSDNRRISVAEMPNFDGVTLIAANRAIGAYLLPVFSGLDVRLGISGGHANLAYRAAVPVAIEVAAGLTDAYIAHLPLPPRGKVGHERPWPLYPEYLERRGMNFMLELSYHTGGLVDAARDIIFPAKPVPLPAKIVVYDRTLMRALKLRDKDIQFVDFEQALDDYIKLLPQKNKADVAKDFAGFRRFYFDHNDDAERRFAIEAFLAH